MSRAALALVICALGLGACDRPDGPPAGPPREPPASASSLPRAFEPDAAASSAAATGSALAADAGAEPSSLLGAWAGHYAAKKATVVLPPKIKDKARAADEGKAAVGAGTIALTVEPTGEVRGTSKGALGEATLAGKIDGAWLRASFMPDDPTLTNAMTGVFVAKIVDGKLDGELRAAGPDAVLVREATVSLTRK